MDETELTRKAILEIMREMDAQKEADKLPQLRERKLNPLGRPNKDFLDRTLNSVMTHNKRQWERNYRNCQTKLKDMDEAKAGDQPKRQVRERCRSRRKMKRKRRRSVSTTSSSSRRDSSSSKERKTKHKKSKKKKKRNKKARSKSPSSTSSSSISLDTSSSSSSSTNKSNRKRRKSKTEDFGVDYERDGFYPQHVEHLDPTSLGYYVDPNMALAAMAYSHMNQILQHQQQQCMQDLVKEELEHNESDDNKVDIPSDLSLTYHSESELNISLNSSSAEEDENGVLTFKLTSDEEQMTNKAFSKTPRKRKLPTKPRGKFAKSKDSNENEITLSDTSSEPNKTSKEEPDVSEEITIISSSSSSDSEQEVLAKHTEVITTIINSSSSSSETDNDETRTKLEDITILSSCSSDTEENDVGTKNQEEKVIASFNHKDLKTDSDATEGMPASSDLTNSDNKQSENSVVETISSATFQKQVEETTIVLSRSSPTNLTTNKLEIVLSETTHSNSSLTEEGENLATEQLCENQTHQETSSSSYSDTGENSDTKKSHPTNDASSSVEKQVETTVLNKDEQNTKGEKTTISNNITAKSDSKEIEKDSRENENEIRLPAAKQEETSDLKQRTQSITEVKVNEALQKSPEHIEYVEKEMITTETDGNAIVLEEKASKTDGNVTEFYEVKQNCSGNEEKDRANAKDDVNAPANAILLHVTANKEIVI